MTRDTEKTEARRPGGKRHQHQFKGLMNLTYSSADIRCTQCTSRVYRIRAVQSIENETSIVLWFTTVEWTLLPFGSEGEKIDCKTSGEA